MHGVYYYWPGTGSLNSGLQVGEKDGEIKGVDVALHLRHQIIQLPPKAAL